MVFKPYGQAFHNLKKAVPCRVDNCPKEYEAYKAYKCMHLLVGLALLIPIINSVALFILHRKYQAESMQIMQDVLEQDLPGHRITQTKSERLQAFAKTLFNSIRHPSSMKMWDRLIGIKLQSAQYAGENSFLAGAALRARKFKLFAFFALMSAGHVINSTFHLFFPREIRELSRINPV